MVLIFTARKYEKQLHASPTMIRVGELKVTPYYNTVSACIVVTQGCTPRHPSAQE